MAGKAKLTPGVTRGKQPRIPYRGDTSRAARKLARGGKHVQQITRNYIENLITGGINHNDLSALQGGATNDYYHWTQQEYQIFAINSGASAGIIAIDALDVLTYTGDLIVTGDVTVQGTTTTIDTATLLVEDKNIEMGVVSVPSDVTANGGGITLKGATDKTIIWDNTNDNWTLNQDLNIPTGKVFKINNVDTLSADTLGAAVVNSSLENLGTLTSAAIDNLLLDGNTISSIAGDINITPLAGEDVVIDAHWQFDGADLTALTDANTVINAFAGKNITIESVTFDGGVVGGATLTTPTIADLSNATHDHSNAAGGGALNATNTDLTTLANVTTVGALAAGSLAAGFTPINVANVINLASLDIDGGTDIAAALAGTDLIIVDDGAGGTNRKSALSRIPTYLQTLDSVKVGIGVAPGSMTATGLEILDKGGTSQLTIKETGSAPTTLNLDSNRSAAESNIGLLLGSWDGTVVSRIVFRSGSDDVNKDDGYMQFFTSDGGSLTEKMRIEQDGNVGIGTASPSYKLQLSGNVSGTSLAAILNGSSTGSGLLVQAGSTIDHIPLRVQTYNGGLDIFNIRASGDIYAPSLKNVAGTYPVEWNSSTGRITYDSSSKRFKKNIVDSTIDSSKIFLLKAKEYDRTNYDAHEFGWVAEQAAEVFPEMAIFDEEGLPSYVHYKLAPVLLTQELDKTNKLVEELATRIKQLEAAVLN